ncbi:MAG: hypothetical protein WEB30_15320 [Cyclobacteriaceae bacterium]
MQQPDTVTDFKALAVTSKAFRSNGMILKKYTCDGEDINPPLDIGEVPAKARSLAIVMEDPDAPSGTYGFFELRY